MEEEKIDQDPRIEERESFFQIKRDLKGVEEEEEEGGFSRAIIMRIFSSVDPQLSWAARIERP